MTYILAMLFLSACAWLAGLVCGVALGVERGKKLPRHCEAEDQAP